jgi:hypothetical protein
MMRRARWPDERNLFKRKSTETERQIPVEMKTPS